MFMIVVGPLQLRSVLIENKVYICLRRRPFTPYGLVLVSSVISLDRNPPFHCVALQVSNSCWRGCIHDIHLFR